MKGENSLTYVETKEAFLKEVYSYYKAKGLEISDTRRGMFE